MSDTKYTVTFRMAQKGGMYMIIPMMISRLIARQLGTCGMYCVKMERLLEEVQGLVLKTVKYMMMGK